MLDALTQKDIIFQFGRRMRKARFLDLHFLNICFSLIVMQVFLTHPVKTHAQSETPSAPSMTESSLTETRSAFREPSFLKKGSGLRWQGVFLESVSGTFICRLEMGPKLSAISLIRMA